LVEGHSIEFYAANANHCRYRKPFFAFGRNEGLIKVTFAFHDRPLMSISRER
jgi:hypothetical protein